MVSSAIMYVSFLLLVTSFVAVEWRNLFAAVHTYQVQSVLIALTFALYAHSLHNPALYYWSAVALLHALRVDAAGGVVGAVFEKNSACSRSDRRTRRAPPRAETQRRFPPEPCARRGWRYKTGTRQSQGSWTSACIAGVEDRLQDHVARACGADRHKDVLGP